MAWFNLDALVRPRPPGVQKGERAELSGTRRVKSACSVHLSEVARSSLS